MGKKSSNCLIFMQYFWVCWLARKNSYLEPPHTKYRRRRPPSNEITYINWSKRLYPPSYSGAKCS